jgi:hypothetical protein
MEITIPSWAVWMIGTFGGGFLGWLITLTLMAFRSREEIRLSSAKDIEILSNISRLEEKVDQNKNDLNVRLEKIDDKMDKLFNFILLRGASQNPSQGSLPV